MAETVTTLERAIEVLNEAEYAGCKGWHLSGDVVASPGPTLFGERNPTISRKSSIYVANQLIRYAEPKDAEPDARSQILALADLKDGWYDGQGAAYDADDLARVADVIDRLAAVGKARVYPMPDGGVCIEWGDRPKDDSIEINPKTLEASWHLYDHDKGRESCGEAKTEPIASPPLALEELGAIAYGAAMIAFWPGGGNYPFGTRPLPWDELEPSVQRGWIAAAVAVVDRMPTDKPPQVGPATKRVMTELSEVLSVVRLHRPIVEISTGRVGAVPLDVALAALRECGMEGDSR